MDYMDVGRCFSILQRRSQAFIGAACEHLQLTYSEYVMLVCLLRREGISQDALATEMYMDKAIVTRTAALLEEKGLLRRERDGQDRRVKRLYPTDAAREQETYLRGLVGIWVEHLFSGMKPEERDAMVRGMLLAADRACETNIPELVRRIRAERGQAK